MTDERLKEAVKSAIVEVLDERRDLLATLIEEVIEDIGLRKAMEDASDSPPATRAEVFKILSGDE